MKKNNIFNSFFENTNLSANMEDYLEKIALLSAKNRIVRVKDIAGSLNIKMPSVTAALSKLKEKKLIHYEKYGFVELTEEGKKLAGSVYKKHEFLKKFLFTLLCMDRESADAEACRLEHHLSPLACKQISRLVEFYISQKDKKEQWTGELENILQEKSLSDLKSGDDAVIVKISGDRPFKKRLIEMGFRKGEKLKVIKYAPLRDPLEILIKGYHISLRVEEAKEIIVRALDGGQNPDNEK